jgi:3-phenylpropionate/trans-cinnamate dioxygenase ferredoxin reductase component
MSEDKAGMMIIGGGLAGAKAAEALRSSSYSGAVTLISNEVDPPYERPPLSKSYLAGKSPFDDALVHPLQWYADNRIDLRTSTTATSLDLAGHTVTLDDGTVLSYAKLLLATGATPRRLSVSGADAANVFYLRGHVDSDRIRTAFGRGRRLAIIGAGWIGLEVAAAARAAGTDVTILEAAQLPLLNVLGPQLGRVFADLHRDNGVHLRLGVTIDRVTLHGELASGVRLADGTRVSADSVVIGVGAVPNIGLAEAAGLHLDNGILVDRFLRTSDPHVYAVGDIANQDHPTLHTRVRVEHWATALNQPQFAVRAMLGSTGSDAIYSDLPYFYSDQYDVGVEYIGHIPRGLHTDVVIRGDLPGRAFVAFWLDDANRIRAAMNVNVWDVVETVKPLITSRTAVDPDRLADPEIPIAEATLLRAGSGA